MKQRPRAGTRAHAVRSIAGLAALTPLLFLSNACQSPTTSTPTEVRAPGVLREEEGLRILTLRGTHYDMGFEYGRVLRKDLLAMAERVRELEGSIVRELPWYASPFAGVFKFFKSGDVPERLAPQYVDEIRGMAEGSGMPYRDLLFFAGGAGIMGCASVLARTPEGVIHGRNFDFSPPFLGEFPIVVDSQAPGENRVLNFGIVGYPGLFTGVNDKGLSVSLNISPSRDPDSKGMLSQFKLRRILETAGNLAEVDAFLRSHRNDEQGWMMTFASRADDSGAIYDLVSGEIRKAPLADRTHLYAFNSIFAEHRHADAADLRKKWLTMGIHQGNYDQNREALARSFFARRRIDGVPSLLELLGEQGLGEPGDFPDHGINNDMTMQTFAFEPRKGIIYFAAARGFAAKAPMVKWDLATGKVERWREATPDFQNELRALLDAESAFERHWYRKAPRETFLADMKRPGWLDVPTLGLLTWYHERDPERVPAEPLLAALDAQMRQHPDYAPLWLWKGKLMAKKNPQEALRTWEAGLGKRLGASPVTRLELLDELVNLHRERKEKDDARKRAREALAILDASSRTLKVSGWMARLRDDLRELTQDR